MLRALPRSNGHLQLIRQCACSATADNQQPDVNILVDNLQMCIEEIRGCYTTRRLE